MLKVNADFQPQWRQVFGGDNHDIGMIAEETIDGGYMVVGTVGFENNKVVTFIKTDREGNSLQAQDLKPGI